MKTEIEVGSAIRLGIGVFGILTTAMVLWACVDQNMIHAAAGMAVTLVALTEGGRPARLSSDIRARLGAG